MTKLRNLLLLVLLAPAVNCGMLTPRKPAGVPGEAIWVGSRSEGAFVQIQSKEMEGWKIRVYDRQGRTLAEGLFILRGAARSELLPEDFASYSDGILHLKDGSAMTLKTRS